MQKTFSITNDSQGKALVELAIVIPFLFVFAFSVFEINRVMKAQQISSRMAFETANFALRLCGGDEVPAENNTSFCIRANLGRIASQFNYLTAASGLEKPAMRVAYFAKSSPSAGEEIPVASVDTDPDYPVICPSPVASGEITGGYRVRVHTAVRIRLAPISPILEPISNLLFGAGGVCSTVDIY